MGAFVTALLPAVLLLVLVFVPICVVLITVLFQKWRDKREGRRSPLTDKLLHQAGAHARQRADDIGDTILEHLMQVLLIGPMVMLIILLPRVNWSRLEFSWINWLVVVGAGAWIAWLTNRILGLRKERAPWLQGMRAEIAVAQELDRLREYGCAVFHDLPTGKDFNIDHVVVGPTAVYMVETKSRRKCGQGKGSATVSYDGKALRFPAWVETKPLDQARAQARWLADELRGETGNATAVVPVLCLPGWFVELGRDAHKSDVHVVNPKMRSLFTDTTRRSVLNPAQRVRVIHALQKRYPELAE